MRTVENIENEIRELKEQYVTVRGTDTEVYTRIVGYYRSVRNWNKGKRDEYNQRKLFTQPDKTSLKEAVKTAVSTASSEESSQPLFPALSDGEAKPSDYIYFYRTTCPNCPPVKKWLEGSSLQGIAINVDEKEGFEEAGKYQIYSSPTVVLLDGEGNEISRAGSVKALEEIAAAIPV